MSSLLHSIVDPSTVRRVSWLVLTAAIALMITATAMAASEPTPVPAEGEARILAVPLEEAVDPVMVDIVKQSLNTAIEEDYDAVLFEIDTPGGLVSSMKEVLDAMLNSEVPSIVWVTPRGAQAASAGTFIVQAGDVAAMTPNTTIGSASVVGAQGEDVDSTMGEKVTNELVARIRSMAEDHERNADWAEQAVRKAKNLNADDALEQNVIDFVATSRDDLLTQMEGFDAPLRNITFHTKGATVDEWEVPVQLRILKVLINPNWIFLLLTLGIIGIGFEVTHPGTILPGVVGVISFLLAMYGLQVLPTNTAGLALILLAVLLLIGEAFATSHGILGIGGAISFILGGLMLFDENAVVHVSAPLVVAVGLLLASGFVLLGRKVVRAHTAQPEGGAEGMIGRPAVVRHTLAPRGQVFIFGEIWQARTADGSTVAEGEEVLVDSVDGLTLVVTAPSPTGVVGDTEHSEGVTPAEGG